MSILSYLCCTLGVLNSVITDLSMNDSILDVSNIHMIINDNNEMINDVMETINTITNII